MGGGQRATRSSATKNHLVDAGHTPECWLDLAHLVDELSREKTTWLFRGELATTYELRPSAGRAPRPDAKVTIRKRFIRIRPEPSHATNCDAGPFRRRHVGI